MQKRGYSTQERIVSAAASLFYSEGIRSVSVDAVAEKAGVTKRTLYYHFKSKDDLIAAYLESQDQPNLTLFARWFEMAEGDLAAKIEEVFLIVAKRAERPKWKGCGFLRTSAELANSPGHPALKVGAAHKKKFEAWLDSVILKADIAQSALLARQIVLLWDGAFSVMLVHNDPSYIEAAGKAAASLIRKHCEMTSDTLPTAVS